MQTPYSPTSFQSPSPYSQQFAGQAQPLSTGYHPQSQIQAQYTGYPAQQTSYGYQQQQQQPQQTGYAYPQQAQQPHHQQLLAQFDPYANLGQHLPPSTATTGAAGSPAHAHAHAQGTQHPRIFIRTHKAELEAWDPQTWMQIQGSFDALKAAWETRKLTAEAQVHALGGTVGAPSASGYFGNVGGMSAYGAYGGAAAYSGGVYQTPQAQEIDRLNAVPVLSSSVSPSSSVRLSLMPRSRSFLFACS
jgi:hypothetical protein